MLDKMSVKMNESRESLELVQGLKPLCFTATSLPESLSSIFFSFHTPFSKQMTAIVLANTVVAALVGVWPRRHVKSSAWLLSAERHEQISEPFVCVDDADFVWTRQRPRVCVRACLWGMDCSAVYQCPYCLLLLHLLVVSLSLIVVTSTCHNCCTLNSQC